MCLATTALLFSLTGCDTAPPAEDPPRLASALVEGQVVDLRAEFSQSFCGLFEKRSDLRAGFEHCEQVLHQTPVVVQQPSAAETQRSARVYLVPGLFGECVERLVTPWKIARSHLERLGYTVELVEVGGRSGIERNARLIRDHLMASPQDGRRSIALGYSKGAIDLLEALRAYPELHPRIDAAVAVAGPIHGAPLAESSPDWLTRLATWLRLPDCSPGDGLGIASMTPKQRAEWLTQWQPPASVRLFSLGAYAPPNRTSRILRPGYKRLARIDRRNDGQVLAGDTLVPGSSLLGFAIADHWAIALPFDTEMPKVARLLVSENRYPRTLLLEAILAVVESELDQVENLQAADTLARQISRDRLPAR